MDSIDDKHPNSRPNNQAALTHGGAAARKHLSAGTEFSESSPARIAELAIQAELETVGRQAIRERNRRRTQAIVEIYANEVFEAEVQGDKKRRDSYAKIFLWATRLAEAQWAEAAQEEKSQDKGLDYEKLLEAQKNGLR